MWNEALQTSVYARLGFNLPKLAIQQFHEHYLPRDPSKTGSDMEILLFYLREALMLCVLNVITEHHQQYQLVLIILFQAVLKRRRRFVIH